MSKFSSVMYLTDEGNVKVIFRSAEDPSVGETVELPLEKLVEGFLCGYIFTEASESSPDGDETFTYFDKESREGVLLGIFSLVRKLNDLAQHTENRVLGANLFDRESWLLEVERKGWDFSVPRKPYMEKIIDAMYGADARPDYWD